MFKGIVRVAWEELKVFFFNSKLILIVFELLIFCETFLVEVKNLSETSGVKLSYFEPYLLICSSEMYKLAIPIVFLVLLSGFPSKRSYNYFSMIRISRVQWLLGELLFVICSAIGYMLLLGAGLVLYMGRCIRFDAHWSDYMLHFYEQFPDLIQERHYLFLDTSVMTHGSPMYVFVYSLLFMLGMLLLVALIQITFALLRKKYIGMLLTVGLTLASALTLDSSGFVKWFFPMAHASFGAHFNGFRAEKNMEFWKSYLYFGVMFVVLAVLDFSMIRKINMEAESEV